MARPARSSASSARPSSAMPLTSTMQSSALRARLRVIAPARPDLDELLALRGNPARVGRLAQRIGRELAERRCLQVRGARVCRLGPARQRRDPQPQLLAARGVALAEQLDLALAERQLLAPLPARAARRSRTSARSASKSPGSVSSAAEYERIAPSGSPRRWL